MSFTEQFVWASLQTDSCGIVCVKIEFILTLVVKPSFFFLGLLSELLHDSEEISEASKWF